MSFRWGSIAGIVTSEPARTSKEDAEQDEILYGSDYEGRDCRAYATWEIIKAH